MDVLEQKETQETQNVNEEIRNNQSSTSSLENNLENESSKEQQEKMNEPEVGKPIFDEDLSDSQAETEDEEASMINDEIEKYSELSEGGLVEKAKALMKSDPDSYLALKPNMDAIKHVFYKKIKAKNEAAAKKFVEDGGVAEDFTIQINPLEEELKEILNRYKEKRASELVKSESEKKANLETKKRILEDLKSLLDSTDDFGKKVPMFQKLQQEWKTVGIVPVADLNALWKTYQLYVENFYDSLKINNELRDYDFRKNLEQKTILCEQAEKLAEETDIVSAFRKLQRLHDEWREIGPVSKEQREAIWLRFKDASTIVNKKHHDYFDKLREGETNNLQLKTALCEKIEAIDITVLNSYKEWQEKSDEIIAIQAEWKKIGFAPKKENISIYERFRVACDNFFKNKNEFFKSTKEQSISNLTKKIALCEKAEALKDSVEWKETTDKLVQLQKDWKTIGAVPKKQSDAVWKRFVTACDYFFEQKEIQFKQQRSEQDENLKKKKELIEQINALEITEDHNDSFLKLKALIAEWNEVGHVPFKDKDKVYKAYKSAIDGKFDKLDMDQSSRRMDVFKANLQDMSEKGQQKLFGERKRLMRQYDAMTNDITTYENNIGFFSNSSKGAAGMIKDMEAKIQKLKKERELIVEKIKMLEDAAK